MKYTITPVTDTYIHNGHVQRAMSRWRSKRSRNARLQRDDYHGHNDNRQHQVLKLNRVEHDPYPALSLKVHRAHVPVIINVRG